MTKLIITAALALAMAACGNSTATQSASQAAQEQQQPAAQTDTTQAKAQIEKMLQEVYASYATAKLPNELPDHEHQLCSSDYLKTFDAVNQLEQQAIDGEWDNLFFDLDHWVQAQDYEKPQLKIAGFAFDGNGNKCTVQAQVSDFGQSQQLNFEMVLEDGTWKVDDFLSPDDKGQFTSEKSQMKEYLAQHKATVK